MATVSSHGAAVATIQKVGRGFIARSKFNVNTSTFIAQRRSYQVANVVTTPFSGQNYNPHRSVFDESDHRNNVWKTPVIPAILERTGRALFSEVIDEVSVESADDGSWLVEVETATLDTRERLKKPATVVEMMVEDTMKRRSCIHQRLDGDVDIEKVADTFRTAIKSVSEKGYYKLANPHSTVIKLHNLADLATTFVKFRYYTGTDEMIDHTPLVCRVSPIQVPSNSALPRQAPPSVYATRLMEKTPRQQLADAKAELARLQAEKKQRDEIKNQGRLAMIKGL